MAENGIFRSALSGFNKQDVLDYIDRITAEWDAERQQLTARAEEADGRVAAAEQAAAEANAAAEEAQKAAAAAKEQLAEVEEQLRHATGELDTKNVTIQSMEELLQEKDSRLIAAEQEVSALTAQRDEAISAVAEAREQVANMEATARRLHETQEQLTKQSARLSALQQEIARYEAVLGSAETAQHHVDNIVRPFIEQANRQADETLDSVQAVLAGVLAQLGELQGNVDQRRQALQRCKSDSDSRLSAAFGDWMAQARQAAATKPVTDRHFFR
ncbi:MAG: hypothetical protein IJO76_02910 [Clostridia bacterium]|nr:hypothetical protein [Clostridia bacterium]